MIVNCHGGFDMKIAIASDHAGFTLKEAIKKHYEPMGITFDDLGTNNENRVDYPDYGKALGKAVMTGSYDFGIGICGTGIGIGIAANKVKGVRAALVYDQLTAELAKKHNNANVITLGGRTTSIAEAIKLIDTFKDTSFEARHQTRIDKIKGIEEAEDE